MAGSSNQDIFDVRKIRRLIQLMKEHDLAEMDLRQGDARVQLRRGDQHVVASPLVPATIPASGTPAAAEPRKSSSPAAATDRNEEEHSEEIKSLMVGTFYLSPDPDSTPYVKVGDSVGKGTTVCMIEAMKVFNEIQSEFSGKVVAILVENGEPVEFGQPLFKIDTQQ
jgi:acetyl-CoA carboxylase biotin carboxyl carrier protein